MPAFDNEDSLGGPGMPAARRRHEIGQLLDSLSIEELAERIALLRAEIERLESQSRMKEASRRSADAFFKT